MNKLICILFMHATLVSCKTVDVRQSWSHVTHRVSGERLACVSYEGSSGVLVVPTDETEIIWALKPGGYLFSVQAVDCEGLYSGFTEPVEFEVKGE